MTQLLLFIRSALSGLRQTPFVHSVAILTLGIALFAGALARAGQTFLTQLLGRLGTEVEVTLYFAESATDAQVEAVRAQVAKETGGPVELVTPAAALARLRNELGPSGSVLDDLPENPLPRSLEVRPPPGPPDANKLREQTARWSKLSGVVAVDYGREWIDRLARLHKGVESGAGIALILVLLAAVVVVAATLQLAAYARRDEIEIQKLVGATDLFVRTPFLIEGLLQGLLGAGLAAVGLWLCERTLGPRLIEGLGPLWGDLAPPALLNLRHLVELLGAGALLGVLGSSIAVGRFLRV